MYEMRNLCPVLPGGGKGEGKAVSSIAIAQLLPIQPETPKNETTNHHIFPSIFY